MQESSSSSSAPENQSGMNIVKCSGKELFHRKKKDWHLPDMQPEKGTHPAPPTPPWKKAKSEVGFILKYIDGNTANGLSFSTSMVYIFEIGCPKNM